MHVAILSARTGWHTDELLRALTSRGHTGTIVPYESLLARLGPTSSLNADAQPLFDAEKTYGR